MCIRDSLLCLLVLVLGFSRGRLNKVSRFSAHAKIAISSSFWKQKWGPHWKMAAYKYSMMPEQLMNCCCHLCMLKCIPYSLTFYNFCYCKYWWDQNTTSTKQTLEARDETTHNNLNILTNMKQLCTGCLSHYELLAQSLHASDSSQFTWPPAVFRWDFWW